jgi:rubrerythrin
VADIDLKTNLEREATEEKEAWQKYNRWAEEAERLGRYSVATELRSIAKDEYRHRDILERIIRRL